MARPQVDIVSLEPGHLCELSLQRGIHDSILRELERADVQERLCRAPIAYAALHKEEVLCAAGVVEIWPGRGIGWFIAGEIPWRAWPPITDAVRASFAEVEAVGFHRLEISVQDGHANGHSWARILGFTIEAKLEAYMPDASDGFLYSIIFRRREA